MENSQQGKFSTESFLSASIYLPMEPRLSNGSLELHLWRVHRCGVRPNHMHPKKLCKDSDGETAKMDRQMRLATICLTLWSPSPQPMKYLAPRRHAMATSIPDMVSLLKSRMEERLGWLVPFSGIPHFSQSTLLFLQVFPDHWFNSPF